MKKLYLSFFLLLSTHFLFAQANALVMGDISEVEFVKTIDIRVNQKYLDNHIRTYSSNILTDNSFAFAVEMLAPQFIRLVHSRNTALLYLEPGDSLLISAAANSFQYSMKFDGPAGHNNTFLHQYLKDFPREFNQFETLQYRQGTYWYSIDKKMDHLMQNFLPATFSKKLQLRKEKALAALDFYDRNHPGKLSPNFKEYMASEIFYDWAYHMLLYGTVFKHKHQIKDSFFDFLIEVPLQSSQIGSYYYREFLLAYFSYLQTQSEEDKNPYLIQYDLATEKLIDQPLALVQSEIIARAFKKKVVDPMLPNYEAYFKTSPYANFDQKLTQVFEKVMKQHTGSPAPSFSSLDKNNQKIQLSDYKGKVIYLNFWASWCRPCIDKMDAMNIFQKELEEKGVIFINVSLDKDEKKWQEAIRLHNYKGIQLLASKTDNGAITTNYAVKAIPQYFIIGKNGTFAQKPSSNLPTAIKEALVSMSN